MDLDDYPVPSFSGEIFNIKGRGKVLAVPLGGQAYKQRLGYIIKVDGVGLCRIIGIEQATGYRFTQKIGFLIRELDIEST